MSKNEISDNTCIDCKDLKEIKECFACKRLICTECSEKNYSKYAYENSTKEHLCDFCAYDYCKGF